MAAKGRKRGVRSQPRPPLSEMLADGNKGTLSRNLEYRPTTRASVDGRATVIATPRGGPVQAWPPRVQSQRGKRVIAIIAVEAMKHGFPPRASIRRQLKHHAASEVKNIGYSQFRL